MLRNHWKPLKGMVLHEKKIYHRTVSNIWPVYTRMLKVIKVQCSPEMSPINFITIQIQWNKTGIVLDILKKINSALAVKTSFPMIIPGLFWENLVIAPENFFHFSMTTSSKHLVRGKFSWKDSRSWTKICFCKVYVLWFAWNSSWAYEAFLYPLIFQLTFGSLLNTVWQILSAKGVAPQPPSADNFLLNKFSELRGYPPSPV